MSEYPQLKASDLIVAGTQFPDDAERQNTRLLAALAGYEDDADLLDHEGPTAYARFCEDYPFEDDIPEGLEAELDKQIAASERPNLKEYSLKLANGDTVKCRRLRTSERSMPFAVSSYERLMRLASAHFNVPYEEILDWPIGDGYAVAALVGAFRSRKRS